MQNGSFPYTSSPTLPKVGPGKKACAPILSSLKTHFLNHDYEKSLLGVNHTLIVSQVETYSLLQYMFLAKFLFSNFCNLE